jgi:hypothetical protein
MSVFCGSVVTIEEIYPYHGYDIREDTGCETWTDEMIEGLVDAKFKPNDIVDTNDNLYGCITDDIEYDEVEKSFKYYVSFIVDGGYYYEYQLKPHKSKDKPNMGEVSDGYHTFNELYEYRLLYNASFFNELAKQNLYDVHKSKKHSDGDDCFGGGWFIVMAELPTGQVSNHYELKDWDLFQIPEKEKANKWDGHTPQDVAKRMREFLTPKPKYPKTYKECCNILNAEETYLGIGGHKGKLLQSFQRLLICRDAYWKIAGEEMGLDGPWVPDYKNPDIDLYVIINSYNQVDKAKYGYGFPVRIFTFPTAEMRDAFYENFKNLIEECKELL